MSSAGIVSLDNSLLGGSLLMRVAESLGRSVGFGMRLIHLRHFIGMAHDFGGGFIRESQIVLDGSAVLDLEENHRRGKKHTTDEDTPARGEFGHVCGLLCIQARRVVSYRKGRGGKKKQGLLTSTFQQRQQTGCPCRNQQNWPTCGCCWRENPCTNKCRSGKQRHRSRRTCTGTWVQYSRCR